MQSNLSQTELNALSRKPRIIDEIPSSYEKRPDFWKDVDKETWQSPIWQFANRLFEVDAIQRVIDLDTSEIEAIRKTQSIFSTALSPHYAALIRHELGQNCPIRRQAIPSLDELHTNETLLDDPLGERSHAIEKCAVRRYPDRALLYTTHECAMRCRHCTRRQRVGMAESISKADLQNAINAIVQNENIRDVLVSGGDPLTLPNSTLDFIFSQLKKSPHIDVVRLCTRMVCTMPQRFFDDDLLRILEKHAPLYVNTQFNHPFEATREAQEAFKRLRNAGCILGNQSVLLKNINDSADTLEPLFRFLLKNGCRPYYLFLCDVAQGTDHFRTTIQAGLDIMKQLRGTLSGLAIPHFVIDLPNGFGKLDLANDPILQKSGDEILFKNWFGKTVVYHEPCSTPSPDLP